MKRRWFQIHLSTAVVLMFVAGVILWANNREQCVGRHGVGSVGFTIYEVYERGWPLPCYERMLVWGIMNPFLSGDSDAFFLSSPPPTAKWECRLLVFGLMGDIFIAFIVISFVFFVSEKRIRRREARKP